MSNGTTNEENNSSPYWIGEAKKQFRLKKLLFPLTVLNWSNQGEQMIQHDIKERMALDRAIKRTGLCSDPVGDNPGGESEVEDTMSEDMNANLGDTTNHYYPPQNQQPAVRSPTFMEQLPLMLITLLGGAGLYALGSSALTSTTTVNTPQQPTPQISINRQPPAFGLENATEFIDPTLPSDLED